VFGVIATEPLLNWGGGGPLFPLAVITGSGPLMSLRTSKGTKEDSNLRPPSAMLIDKLVLP